MADISKNGGTVLNKKSLGHIYPYPITKELINSKSNVIRVGNFDTLKEKKVSHPSHLRYLLLD